MLELIRKDLDPAVKQRIKEILLKAHEDPAAKDALVPYGPNTAKFDELTGIAKKEMDEGRQLFKYVGNHVF